jgi:hypothetical protein
MDGLARVCGVRWLCYACVAGKPNWQHHWRIWSGIVTNNREKGIVLSSGG